MMYSETSTLNADRMRSLLSYAVLAPSSHNTQPWRLEITDRRLALPANDPDDRDPRFRKIGQWEVYKYISIEKLLTK